MRAGFRGAASSAGSAAVRSFFGFLLREGALRAQPGARRARAKGGSGACRITLDVDQMAQLLACKPKSALEVRDLRADGTVLFQRPAAR